MLPRVGVRALLQEMSVRIDAIGRLHRLLMHQNGRAVVDLPAYLREIVDAMGSLASAEHTEFSFDLDASYTASPKQGVAIGLLVGEAITNALKYAHPAVFRATFTFPRAARLTAALSLKLRTTAWVCRKVSIRPWRQAPACGSCARSPSRSAAGSTWSNARSDCGCGWKSRRPQAGCPGRRVRAGARKPNEILAAASQC
jgi:hypothetical protein